MVRSKRQKIEDQGQREWTPNPLGDDDSLEPHQGLHQNSQSQGREIHADRNQIQTSSVRQERFET